MPAIVDKIKEKLHRNDNSNTTTGTNTTGTHTTGTHTTGTHANTGAHTTTGTHNPLDRNHDGKVDLADVRTNVVAPGTATTTTTTTTQSQGLHNNPLDRNHDGRVDSRDLSSGNRLSQGYSTTETAYIQDANRSSVRAEPTLIETIHKDVVVHERIHPVQKEEIQPIIYREREQLDVKQVTQMMHETQIQPTIVQQRELAPEVRAAVVERAAPIQENIILPTSTRDATLRSQQVHAPIIEETIKKTIIEEVQPVLERDVIVPTIVQNTQPIYEKIVEAPVVTREIRDMREMGTRQVYTAAAPVQVQHQQREVIHQQPIMEHVTMSTTTTTTDSFIPAKLIQEGELRNFQPASSQVAPQNAHRV